MNWEHLKFEITWRYFGDLRESERVNISFLYRSLFNDETVHQNNIQQTNNRARVALFVVNYKTANWCENIFPTSSNTSTNSAAIFESFVKCYLRDGLSASMKVCHHFDCATRKIFCVTFCKLHDDGNKYLITTNFQARL